MSDDLRIRELESEHEAWQRRSRWRMILLLLVPLLAGAGLVWANRTQLNQVKTEVARGFAAISGQPPETVAQAPLPDILAQLGKLASEVAELRGVRDELGAEKAQRAALEQELGQARAAIESERAIQGDLDAKLAALDAELEATRANSVPKTEADQLRAQLDAAQSEIATLRTGQVEAGSTIATLQAERERLARELESREAAQAAMERQLAALGNELERLRPLAAKAAELDALRAQLDEARREVAALQGERAALQQRLDQALAEAGAGAERLASRLATAEAELSGLRKVRDGLQTELDATGDRLAAAEARGLREATLASRLATAEQEITALHQIRADLQRQLDEAGDRQAAFLAAAGAGDLDEAQARLAQADALSERVRELEAQLGAAEQAMAERVATLEAEIQGLRKVRDGLQAELDRSSDQLAGLLQAGGVADAAAAGSRLSQFAGLDARLRSVEAELATAQQTVTTLETERDAARRQVEQLTQELTATRTELERVRSTEDAEAASRVASLEAEVARLTRERDEAQARLALLEQQIALALTRNELVGGEMAELREALDRAKAGPGVAGAEAVALAATEDKFARLIGTALDSAKQRLDEQTRRIGEAEAELLRLRQERDAIRQEQVDAAQARAALDQKIAALEAERDAQEQERKASQARLATLEQELEASRQRATAAAEEAARARQMLTAAQAEAERKLGETLAQARVAAESAARLRDEIAQLQDAKVKLNAQLSALETAKRTVTDAGTTLAEGMAPIDIVRGKATSTSPWLPQGDVDGTLLNRAQQLEMILAAVPGSDDADYLNGDPLHVPSAVLFRSGSASLKQGGEERLRAVVRRLKDLTEMLPSDLPWIVRVDGHTDSLPIRSSPFKSNLELSTARAVAVAKFLIDQGVPAERIVPAGFGDHYPVVAERTDSDRALNRRIEIKLGLR